MKRSELLNKVSERNNVCDILIIGGGATGLGTAVDAASRGFNVVLLEQDDFAKATSSRSTKLVHGLIYGVSKFINGFIGDRVNARYFMVSGLILSSACNLIFGFSSAVLVFGIVWMANGWFQGMGFPPCARLLTHWVPPKELATKMSIWNTSHSIGAGLVVIVCGYVVSLGWRWCFFFPSAIALFGAVLLWSGLRDIPASVGLPEICPEGMSQEESEHKDTSKEFKQFVRRKVFMHSD